MNRIRIWPGMVFGLLGLNMCVVGATVYLAHSDASVAIEPDYYGKALRWEEHSRADAQSRALGWTMVMNTGPAVGPGTTLAIALNDAQGVPVANALVRIEVFHNLRSGERQQLVLRDNGDGVYAGRMDAGRSGLWQFRVTAMRGSDTFTRVIERDIAPAGRPAP